MLVKNEAIKVNVISDGAKHWPRSQSSFFEGMSGRKQRKQIIIRANIKPFKCKTSTEKSTGPHAHPPIQTYICIGDRNQMK